MVFLMTYFIVVVSQDLMRSLVVSAQRKRGRLSRQYGSIAVLRILMRAVHWFGLKWVWNQ